MECTIHWQPASGMAFLAETGSGHIINMDGAPEGGGRNLAPRPMETVLAGTGNAMFISMIGFGIQTAAGILRAGKDNAKKYTPRHLMIDVDLVTPENAKDYYFPDSIY